MNRSTLMAIGAVALVLLLAGTVFAGGRLIADREPTAGNRQSEVSDSDGGMAASAVMIKTVPANEMPDRAPDVAGLYTQREDNCLFVGTGTLSAVKVDGGWKYHHDGPVIEVVATRDTQIYRDDTAKQFEDVPPSGPVQQVLTPGTVDEIEEDCVISAWGERHGDRLVADVIVFYANG